jgi:endonuclease/exonuclease/phosphatase family metal-dependent hydrolase
MGDLSISHRLHVSAGAPDQRDQLPELPGSDERHEGFLDRVGQGVQQLLPLVAAAGAGGGILGARLLRGSSGGLVRGTFGAILGAIGGTTAAMALGSLRTSTPRTLGTPPSDARVASSRVVADEHVKVMTWNLHGGMGGPGKFGSSEDELDRLAAAIRDQDPDVLVLQEVDQASTRSNYVDTLGELSSRLHPDSAVGGSSNTSFLGRDQQVAVMTFHGFQVSDARDIVHDDPAGNDWWERTRSKLNEFAEDADKRFGTHLADGDLKHVERNSLDTIVRTPDGTDLRVLSGHYEWANPRFDAQGHEVGALAGALGAWRGPTILGADFNVHAGTPAGAREHALLGAAGMHDTFGDTPLAKQDSDVTNRANPDPGVHADGGIDRIYASAQARVLDTRGVTEAGDASDHLPVVTELELQRGS